MEKNMKKIIYASCLVSLLITCNQIISMHKRFISVWKKSNFSSSPNWAILPDIDSDEVVPLDKVSAELMAPLDEASIKLNNLIEQKKLGQKINTQTHNEVKEILFAYIMKSPIEIKDESGKKTIGVCDISNWTSNKDIKNIIRTKIHDIEEKLIILNPKSDESSDRLGVCDADDCKRDETKK